jgi:hypothetical protein
LNGIVHREFVPPNITVNSDVLRRLRENVQWKRPEHWCNYNWLLHHDSAPTHASRKTTEFVANNIIIPYRLYLPDISPCYFVFFPNLKMKLKGRCFETVSDMQRES